jgi:hypothetical protein
MAQKNIEVADQGIKVVLFPKASDQGKRFTLNASESKALRKHVTEYVAADSRELPYADRLKANKRIGLKRSNAMLTEKVMGMLNAAKERGTAPAQSGEVRVYIDESKKSGNSTQKEGGSQGGTPALAAVAAGKNAPRKRSKSDISKMTKADLVRLLEEAGLTK